jgi:hypothetical protein
MHHLNLNEPSIVFQCSEEQVYFGDVRPTAYSPGVLIEIEKKDALWHGVYLVYQSAPDTEAASANASARDMVSSKISFKEADFRDLIGSMRHAFSDVPSDVAFTNEERAAIEVASELKWHFPKKMIAQLQPLRQS